MEKGVIRNKFIAWKKDIVENKNKIFIALGLLLITLILDYISGIYTSSLEINHVPDLILDHIPPIDLSIIFVWVYISVVALFFIYPVFFNAPKIHTALIMLSAILSVRALFIVLTHFTMPLDAIPVTYPWIINEIGFQNDLFFSGHTAVPFMGFLIFNKKFIKYFMLTCSIVLGATTLLMHRHYSIDVFAAFFITYAVYRIGKKIYNNKALG